MMRARTLRRAVPIAVFAALAAGVPAAASAAAGGGGLTAHGRTVAPSVARSGALPQYAARLTSCHRSLRVEGRTAVVGTMIRPVAGSKHLSVKVDLYQRPLAGGHWMLRDDVPGLGTWTSPGDPSIGSRPSDVWRYRQAVGRLEVEIAYRFRVGFRWLDASGAVVREEIATTRTCRQPDLRPNLTIAGVVARASLRNPEVVRYRVTVRNIGRTSARALVAATLPGDATAGARTVSAGRLAPGAVADVTFSGPGCAADGTQAPSFAVDPANAVDEADETDNAFVLVCPVP